MIQELAQVHRRCALVIVAVPVLAAILACNQSASPTPTLIPVPSAQATSIAPSLHLEPTKPPATPTLGAPSQQLAFLKNSDVWLVDVPNGEPIQLTHSGNVMSFAWSPDGERIATFNGHDLCFVQREGGLTTHCIKLGLSGSQMTVERQIVWSPDQKCMVIWNAENPRDDTAIGWLVLSLEEPISVLSIADPLDLGGDLAGTNEPGGVTGEPVFLPDSTLIGTLTHDFMCGSGGCHYQLYQFDVQARRFTPSALGTSADLGEDLTLSADGRVLANLATFHVGCEYYTTYVEVFHLDTGSRLQFSFEQESFHGQALSPDGSEAVIVPGVGCTTENLEKWAIECGLSESFEIYGMELWNFQGGQRMSLPPGLFPVWSPEGDYIAFQSCLAQTPDGQWGPTSSGPPWIFIMEPTGDHSSIVPVLDGASPVWRPLCLP